MTQVARAVVLHMLHHLTQRGNRRRETFFGDDNYQAYLELQAQWRGAQEPLEVALSN